MLYESDILLKNTGIHRIKLAYDINNANLYNELCTNLWTMFSPQIIKKTHIKSLPPNPEEYLSLSDGESRLPDQETLLGVLKEAKGKKIAHINLTYDHPFEEEDSISDPNSPSPKRYVTRASITTSNSSRRAAGTSKKSSTATTWALGPLAGMQALFLEVLQSLKLIKQTVRNYDWSGA